MLYVAYATRCHHATQPLEQSFLLLNHFFVFIEYFSQLLEAVEIFPKNALAAGKKTVPGCDVMALHMQQIISLGPPLFNP